jgi:monoamine oxidase
VAGRGTGWPDRHRLSGVVTAEGALTDTYDIAIVGAGTAGVGAARRITQTGRSVVVLEAGTHVGGRALTIDVAGMALDLGCGWLHSGERNPWTAIADASGFTVDRSESAWREQYRDLGFPAAERRAATAAWTALQRRFEHDPPISDRAADALEPGDPWNAYAQALSGYINGASLDRLSIADYLAYDRAASETNWRVREGYGALVAASLPAMPLHLATPVTAIDHRRHGIRLDTRAGPITARAAIVTVSTAVLAAGTIAFSPAIDDHLDAAACLPLGLANKLFLALAEGHGLEPETHLIGNPHCAETGSHYLMPFGRPVIESFYGGAGAAMLEHEGMAGAFAFAIDELVALLGHDIRRKLRPIAGSSWCRTDHIGGSYSHALPGHAARRATLAAPATNRLFFAGEATHTTDFSTAHGAYESGIRAADQALNSLRKGEDQI